MKLLSFLLRCVFGSKYRRLRCALRGRAEFSRETGFGPIRQIKNDLADVELGHPTAWVVGFFGASAPVAELVARQFVLDRYGNQLSRALFEARGGDGSIRMAMPRPWRVYLAARGWKVGPVSALAWHWKAFARLCLGVRQAIRLCVTLWRSAPASPIGRYVMFEGLGPLNLPPVEESDRPNHDICSFYARWSGRQAGVAKICHGLSGALRRTVAGTTVCYRPPVWELAGGRVNALRLGWWVLRAGLVALAQMAMGRWQYAFLLAEATRARTLRFCPAETLADDYLFHASGTIYRPMWTYDAQQQGASVTLYFYSTYAQPKVADAYESTRFVWGPATWPRCLVWDSWQEDMLRRDWYYQTDMIHAGAIGFSDSGEPLPPLPQLSVAVFGLQPSKGSRFVAISTLFDFLCAYPDYFSRFLSEVSEVVAELGGTAVIKDKRDIGNRCDRRYECTRDREVASGRAIMVSPGIAPTRVISGCRASISIPFTSTAIFGKELGVPSAYFDPVGCMEKDDLGAHGVPLLRGKGELRIWLEGVFSAEAIPDSSVADGKAI